MKFDETIRILEQIDAAYPNKLKINENTADLWHRHLQYQDYEKTVFLLDCHIERSNFPPTIYELKETVKAEHKRFDMNKYEKWEREASGPPPKHRS